MQRFNELIKAERVLTEAEVEEVFNQLPALSPKDLVGKWTGGSFNTGHPTHQQLASHKWAGKDFRSVNDVDPIMLFDDQGNRFWYSEYGHAQVRTEIVYHSASKTHPCNRLEKSSSEALCLLR